MMQLGHVVVLDSCPPVAFPQPHEMVLYAHLPVALYFFRFDFFLHLKSTKVMYNFDSLITFCVLE